MLIMGLEDEYKEALRFVEQINFLHSETPVKGFETGIRYLGGLLSAYELAPDRMLLQQAATLTDNVLLPLFDQSPSKAPYTNMDLVKNRAQPTDVINLAEFGTYTLEFTRLSQILNDGGRYAAYANNLVDRAIQEPSVLPGLYPTSWDVEAFHPINSSLITIGGGADSFYEYLIKNFLLLGEQNDQGRRFFDAWQNAVDSIQTYLATPLVSSASSRFFVAAISDTAELHYISQELICFWPGNILLGATQITDPQKREKYRQFADDFMNSCLNVWKMTETGLAPESWTWITGGSTKRDVLRAFSVDNGLYDLRPETLESVFYFYRMTGDPVYQDIAWDMFQAINKYTRTPSGFTRILNVDTDVPEQDDFQESYLFAETFKYLYLIFVDKDCISLDDYVFNTEAHPFRLPRPIQVQKQ
ncbi:glycoside hydrolase [Fennellomyces sp. T-0311]|nr:glycoside hydrolase [Fennellomyces sp. T-0311]